MLALFLLVCPLSVFAQYEGENLVFFYISTDPFALDKVVPVNFIKVYHYNDITPPSMDDAHSSYELLVEDSKGAVIYKTSLGTIVNPAPYDVVKSAARIKVINSGEIVFDNPLSFCNKNSVCEPCRSTNCDTAENSLVCSDCPSGSVDSYCDEERDGICDPDCGGERDFDCGIVCSEMGGEECVGNELCVGGNLQMASDTFDCCVGGRCRNLEQIETAVELQKQPSLTITPNGDFASSIQEQGIGDYCHKSLKGMNCEPNQLCNGTEVQYYQDVYCCIGVCITPEDVIFPEIVNKTVIEEAPVEDINAFIERDRAHFEIEQQMIASEPREKLLFAVEKLVPQIPPQLKGSSLPLIVGSLLAVLLVITVIVALFRRSAAKKLQSEQKTPEPVQDLQQTIDSMVSKGFSYAQVRDYLLQQGIPQDKAAEEIRKNYDSRKSSQLK
jgi:hypothetical protein